MTQLRIKMAVAAMAMSVLLGSASCGHRETEEQRQHDATPWPAKSARARTGQR
jgi:hypothetical protein